MRGSWYWMEISVYLRFFITLMASLIFQHVTARCKERRSASTPRHLPTCRKYSVYKLSVITNSLCLNCSLQRVVEILITKLWAIWEGVELSSADDYHGLLLLIFWLLLAAVVEESEPLWRERRKHSGWSVSVACAQNSGTSWCPCCCWKERPSYHWHKSPR